MCVGVPGKVISRDDYTAVIDVMGSKMKVGIIFIPEVKMDDYVIVHAGQAMSIIDEDFAKLSIEEWRKIANVERSS